MAPLCLSTGLWMPQPLYHCTYCLKGDLLPPSWGIFSGSPGYDSFSTPCPLKWPTVCSLGGWGLDSPRAITGYSFKVDVRCHFDHWQSLMFRLSVTKRNIFQVKMFSCQDMIFCFASGYQQVHSHTVFIVVSVLSLPSVLTELFLQPFRVPYNVWLPNRWTFTKISVVLRVKKFENGIFLQLWRAVTATQFSLTPSSILTLWQTWANCLGTSTHRDSSLQIAILSTLMPHCLHMLTTYACSRADGRTTMTRFLKLCNDGKNVSNCFGILLKNNDPSVE
jgi:hypothetical protein